VRFHIARFATHMGHSHARYMLVGCGLLIGLSLAIGMVLFSVELRRQDLAHAEQDLRNLSLVLSEETNRGLQAVELVQFGLIDIDARTTRHPGYRISLAIRKRIEEANGWIKGVAGMDRAAFRGLPRMGGAFTFRTVAYNLIRMPGLLPVG
jgi:hypothetical protein